MTVAALLLAVSAGLLLFGCPVTPPGDNGPRETVGTLSGKLLDGATGLPIAGGTIEFAGKAASSDASGQYSLELVQDSGTLSVHADGYTAIVIAHLTVDSTADSTATWSLSHWNSTSVSHSFTLSIKEQQTSPGTPVAIPPDSTIFASVINENGGISRLYPWYNGQSGLFAAATATWGKSCLVSIFVQPPPGSPLHAFNVVREKVDLSAQTTSLSEFVEDLQVEQAISVTGAAGNSGSLFLAYPPALLFDAYDFDLDQGGNATVYLSNPLSYQGAWQQVETTPFATDARQIKSTSQIGALGSSATLPSIPSLGPTGEPNPSSITYDSATGVLSMDPVPGADSYDFVLFTGATPSSMGDLQAIVVSITEPSLTLPTWLHDALKGKTINVVAQAVDSSKMGSSLQTTASSMITGGTFPGTSVGVVRTSMPVPLGF